MNELKDLKRLLIKLNIFLDQSRCSTFPRRTFSKSIVSCGEIDTDLGALNWCRHNCKRGYRC